MCRLPGAAANAQTPPGQALPSLGHQCKVTIIRRECHIDLQALFLDDPESGPCPCFKAGDEFELRTSTCCPKNFCPQLWNTICAWVNRDDNCAVGFKNAPAVISCPDGTRPVIVRVEKL